MKFFAYNPEVDNEVNRILQSINLRKNGETAELLVKMGMTYKQSYGVSLVHLRQLASSVPVNNQVAQRLWFREVRETMIMATMLADVSTMSADEQIEWAKLINNTELAEQASMNLFAKSKELHQICHHFVSQPNPYICAVAYFATGWALRKDNGADLLSLAEQLIADCTFSHPIVGRGFSHLIRQLCRQIPHGKQIAAQWIAKVENTNSHIVLLAVEEIKQELLFLGDA